MFDAASSSQRQQTSTKIIWTLFLIVCLPSPSLLPGGEAANNCPRKCQCIWRDSKITVDCSNQTLASIPTTVERNTQVLNVSGNDIPTFGRAHFSRLGLINLQRVSCARCNLVSVDAKAFLGLTNLVELDLSNNKLIEIPSEALNGEATALMSLSLRGNPIETIGTRSFHRLKYLTKLDLSECHISNVDPGAFEGLESLQRIYLHNNHLTTISGRDIPPSLHGLSVHDNSWSCDCQLRSFRLWLTQSNVPRPVEPVCRSPRRLVGIRIQSLSLTEFACPPQLSPTSMFLTVPKGKNVSIVCRVSSDPVSQITWFFNGRPLLEDDSAKNQQGIHPPRTSERLLETNLDVSSSTVSSFDIGSGQNRVRVIRQDDFGEGGGSGGETRSELVIEHTGAGDNGTYYCQAENKAARSVSNFTLHVTDRDFNPDGPTILQLRLEYFIAAAIAIIIILILVLVIVAVLLVRICRNRSAINGSSNGSTFSDSGTQKASSNKLGSVVSLGSVNTSANGNGHGCKVAPTMSVKMPKHIQMGTGFVATTKSSPDSKTTLLPPGPVVFSGLLSQPDLLTDHNSSLTTSNGKKSTQATSVASTSSNDGSYRAAMENIIHDYKQVPSNTPLIGGNQNTVTSLVNEQMTSQNDASITASSHGGTLPRVTWSQNPNPKLTTFQAPLTSLGYSGGSTQSELPLLDHQQLMTSLKSEYPDDFGLPRTAPSRSSNFPDYVHLSSLLGRASQHHSSWLTLPTPQQYRLESPLYFAAPKQQMMPDEKYPDPSQQQVSPVTAFSVMNFQIPSSASMPTVTSRASSSARNYFNHPNLGQNSGSKSLVLTPNDLSMKQDKEEESVYHSISGPCQSYDDETARNGGAPIYESIEHPAVSAFLNQNKGDIPSIQEEEMSGNYSKPYELVNLSSSKPAQQVNPVQQFPVDPPQLDEQAKMDLYSKVNKRRSPPAATKKQDLVEPISSTPAAHSSTSSSSAGSPPPLETVAPSRRTRRRSSRQKSPSSIQARSSMALERLTKLLLLSAPQSPPDDNDSFDDMLTEFQHKQNLGSKETLTGSAAPMATSESSCGPTRGATSAEEEDDEAKNINQELDDAFTSLDQESRTVTPS